MEALLITINKTNFTVFVYLCVYIYIYETMFQPLHDHCHGITIRKDKNYNCNIKTNVLFLRLMFWHALTWLTCLSLIQ
jgi:hypothetical protein